MTARKKKWLIAIAVVAGVGISALLITARQMAKRVEPYIRDQAVLYLQERFDSDVAIGALRVSVPKLSPLNLLQRDMQGAKARVEGERIVLRHKGRTDIPPMFVMRKFAFEIDLRVLFDSPRRIPLVTIEGMEITIPPKGERPKLSSGNKDAAQDKAEGGSENTDVIFDEVIIKDSRLTILPRDRRKTVLQFALHRIHLETAGKSVAMKYDAALKNAKPPGEILSKGTFGPWVAGEPGDSHLAGNYTFDDADLGVFSGIAGILDSTGQFEGTLNSITARGEATVPDFRLKRAGNIVPLKTTFEVLVDGTNGNTVLKPVVGTLGTTSFTTSGGVIRHESDTRKTVSLEVDMPKGNLPDLLTLAMKGETFMEGQIALKTKIDIPPLTGKVREKLLLDGMFSITHGKFLRSTIQDQIDMLSRRGQGQPQNMEIDEVVLAMGGRFRMEDERITFDSLSFAVPGSGVDLSGSYALDEDMLDFHGTLKLDARVSETMTGWKRWALKPVDPFFSKQGVGTLLRIQVVGSAKAPKFGRDRGPKEKS
ncbi:MAG TPA: hypothetical protein VFR05_00040 [Terriglobia bacterium]|nr:hypothetical protein [Terriglobia bacterium]